MNIQQAKDQIRRTVEIYLMKDADGTYRIPLERQRPVFMVGSPGIGKTAIMQQIASELDIGLVSYSMTHHTRQSALGLPVIRTVDYDGKEYSVTEYTMSEIIAAIYEAMKASGRKEGILFLDEINCVSETLAPAMLQFLQYKTFGTHRVPDGWVIVTAGNPPQFNRAVREFDVAMMDRLKVLTVEADYDTWRAYAQDAGVHNAILTYLDIRKDDFYRIENTPEGRTYVTARGWEDLSDALKLYEEKDFPVDDMLVLQYIGNRRIAREFSTYYALYCKYKEDYRIQDILDGKADRSLKKRASYASFDERVSLLSLLTDSVLVKIRANVIDRNVCMRLTPILRALGKTTDTGALVPQRIEQAITAEADAMRKARAAGSLSKRSEILTYIVIHVLQDYAARIEVEAPGDDAAGFALIRKAFSERVAAMQAEAKRVLSELDNLFAFVKEVFGEENEMLLLVTHLTVSRDAVRFLSVNTCAAYAKYSRKFEVTSRGEELQAELGDLKL